MAAVSSVFAAPVSGRDVGYSEKPLKVLMIGNSFSICNLKQMPHVAKSMGLKLDLASLYIGGCSLERHWNNVVASTNAAFKPYRFDRTAEGVKVVVRGKANIPDALVLDKWDVVTVQQASHFSWQPATYHPFGDSLVAKIRELAPQARIVVQETWSYPPWDKRLKKFGFDQAEMYARLHGAYAAFAAKHGLDVIPVGTVAEFVPNRNALFTKPDFHFNREGEYLQGLAFTAKLFGTDVRKCPYHPSWMKAARADEIKAAVMDAVASGREAPQAGRGRHAAPVPRERSASRQVLHRRGRRHDASRKAEETPRSPLHREHDGGVACASLPRVWHDRHARYGTLVHGPHARNVSRSAARRCRGAYEEVGGGRAPARPLAPLRGRRCLAAAERILHRAGRPVRRHGHAAAVREAARHLQGGGRPRLYRFRRRPLRQLRLAHAPHARDGRLQNRSSPQGYSITMLVPMSQSSRRRTAFQFERRKQPCDSARPICSGQGVPCMP